MNFGQLIRKKRLKLNLTLREFCKQNDFDVAYISRLENDLMNAPKDKTNLVKLAKALNISKNSAEWKKFIDFASISRNQLPEDIDKRALSFLPAFCRKASKKNITKEDVEQLLKLIKGTK